MTVKFLTKYRSEYVINFINWHKLQQLPENLTRWRQIVLLNWQHEKSTLPDNISDQFIPFNLIIRYKYFSPWQNFPNIRGINYSFANNLNIYFNIEVEDNKTSSEQNKLVRETLPTEQISPSQIADDAKQAELSDNFHANISAKFADFFIEENHNSAQIVFTNNNNNNNKQQNNANNNNKHLQILANLNKISHNQKNNFTKLNNISHSKNQSLTAAGNKLTKFAAFTPDREQTLPNKYFKSLNQATQLPSNSTFDITPSKENYNQIINDSTNYTNNTTNNFNDYSKDIANANTNVSAKQNMYENTVNSNINLTNNTLAYQYINDTLNNFNTKASSINSNAANKSITDNIAHDALAENLTAARQENLSDAASSSSPPALSKENKLLVKHQIASELLLFDSLFKMHKKLPTDYIKNSDIPGTNNEKQEEFREFINNHDNRKLKTITGGNLLSELNRVLLFVLNEQSRQELTGRLISFQLGKNYSVNFMLKNGFFQEYKLAVVPSAIVCGAFEIAFAYSDETPLAVILERNLLQFFAQPVLSNQFRMLVNNIYWFAIKDYF